MQKARFIAPILVVLLMFFSTGICRSQDSTDSSAEQSDAPKTVKTTNKKPLAGKGKLGKGAGTNPSGASEEPSTSGISLSAPRTMEMQFGIRFFSNDNYCTDLFSTVAFPLNWPEQRVTVLSTVNPYNIVWEFRDLPMGSKQNAHARQLVASMRQLAPNNEMDILLNVEIEKSFIDPPPDTSVFVIPKKIGKELTWFMNSSPYIDVDLGEIRRVAKQIASESPPDAWTHVERLYDWVRENIRYQNGSVRKIADALKDKKGDCEEMTGIFVALCRASKIPARCVWIPDHCYPEFYLEDPQGVGHWFPCQAAGDRQFGEMHDYRPILQKGDRFKVPEQSAPLRYLGNFFKCTPRPIGPRGPDVKEILDLGPLTEELATLRQQTDRDANE